MHAVLQALLIGSVCSDTSEHDQDFLSLRSGNLPTTVPGQQWQKMVGDISWLGVDDHNSGR